MITILVVVAWGALVALSLTRAADSRDHACSEEEKLARCGFTWGYRVSIDDQLALASEIRETLTHLQAARSPAGERVPLEESRDWTGRLAA